MGVHRDGDGGTHLSPSATATSVLEAAAICCLQRVMLAGRATFISSLFPEQSCRSKAAVAGLTAVPLLWFWVLIGFAVFFLLFFWVPPAMPLVCSCWVINMETVLAACHLLFAVLMNISQIEKKILQPY